jgi:rhodanese-related sulfurtransferase
MARRILIEGLLLFLIAILLSAASYALRPAALPLRPPPQAAPVHVDEETFKLISIEHAQQLFYEGQALFADARPAMAYEEGRIQGALNLDPGLFEEWASHLLDNHPLDKPIITYCEGPRCNLSHDLAERLVWLGYEKVYYLIDGWGQWKAHGLPVEPEHR